MIQIPSRLLNDSSPPALSASLIREEVQLRCGQANSQILAVQDKSTTLSIRKEMAQMLRNVEIMAYNAARDALVTLKHMKADATDPFPPMKVSDTIRKDTHLFRMRGDSRIVNAAAWRLLASGAPALVEDISGHTVGGDSDEDSEQGTQMNKRTAPNRLSPAKRRKTNSRTGAKPNKVLKEGWIWKDDALSMPSKTNENVAEFKQKSQRQYERKHAEFWRAIRRFRRDADVWRKRADNSTSPGAVAYARMQVAMWTRVATKTASSFKDGPGAHKSWTQATSFQDLVSRIEKTREHLFGWMDELGIERAYKLW
ncbi:hypothetical protein GGX14DRAFT_573869 [Mycena pura]|uniref:Uncharacterized protein n=1 Tax=Mycena pura TaxID=153505 RepID=A0AAD6UYG9_9AGAR|nr:hypothetical protein GGX14DRAFT_573869 [Mycena pura]